MVKNIELNKEGQELKKYLDTYNKIFDGNFIQIWYEG